MADKRFYRRAGPFSVAQVAASVGAEPVASGIAPFLLQDIAPLEDAKPDELTVFTDIRYLDQLAGSRAGAILTSDTLIRHVPEQRRILLVNNPRLAFAQAGYLFYPQTAPVAGIAVSAVVHPSARIGEGSQIDAGAILEADVEVGQGSVVGYNTVLSRGVRIGNGVKIGPNCSISHSVLGDRVEVASGVTIGSEGFGFVPGPTGLLRMLQIGVVIIENDVKLGANCTIDRGAATETRIGAGSVLDNQVHIAHNVKIGRNCVLCGQVGVAGSTIIGDGVMIGGQAGIADHLSIGDGAQISAKCGVIRDVAANTAVAGYPAIPVKTWHRQTLGLAKMFGAKAAGTLRRVTQAHVLLGAILVGI
jgi:UDP-3-O-[3-hydroxymyristoyl] glucosamine N-acyltransferase